MPGPTYALTPFSPMLRTALPAIPASVPRQPEWTIATPRSPTSATGTQSATATTRLRSLSEVTRASASPANPASDTRTTPSPATWRTHAVGLPPIARLGRSGGGRLLLSRLDGRTLRAALVGEALVEARGDHGDRYLLPVRLIDYRAEDEVRILVGGVVDDLRSLVDLEEPQLAPSRDVQDDPRRPVDARFEQRAGDRQLRSLRSPVLAARLPD